MKYFGMLMSALILASSAYGDSRMGRAFGYGNVGFDSKKLQNDISSIKNSGIDTEYIMGSPDFSSYSLFAKIPFKISEFVVVPKVTIPIIKSSISDANDGVGDVEFSLLLTDATYRTMGWYIGYGIDSRLNTAAGSDSGYGRNAIGPKFNLTYIGGPYVIGFDYSHLFDVGGSGPDKIDNSYFTLKLDYNIISDPGTYFEINSKMEDFWSGNYFDNLDIPIGLKMGSLFEVSDNQYVSVYIQGTYFLIESEKYDRDFSLAFGLSYVF